MAVNAPIVEYYRLVEDDNNPSTATEQHLKFNIAAGATDPAPATLLDFGVIDAGSNNDEMFRPGTAGEEITLDHPECQVFAIFNNRGSTAAGYTPTDCSDMQNTLLSVVDNTGSDAGVVVEHKWIQVLANNEDITNDGWTSLGKYVSTATDPQDQQKELNENITTNPNNGGITPGTSETAGPTKKKLTAYAYATAATLDPNKDGIISGDGNDGDLNNATTQRNYVLVKLWPLTNPSAPAGEQLFRLRVTYSYT